MNVIQQIMNATKRRGGYTVNPATGEIPTTGYLVSTGEHEQRVPRVRYADIKAFADKHHDAFADKTSRVFLGTWKQSGITYLDVSVNVPSRAEAICFGVENKQKAIYDIGHAVDIELES